MSQDTKLRRTKERLSACREQLRRCHDLLCGEWQWAAEDVTRISVEKMAHEVNGLLISLGEEDV